MFLCNRGRTFRVNHTNSQGKEQSVVYPALILLKLKSLLHIISNFLLHGTDPIDKLKLGYDYVVGTHIFKVSGGPERKIVGMFKASESGYLDKETGIFFSELYWEKFSAYVEHILQCMNLNDLECEDKFGNKQVKTGARWVRKEVFRAEGDNGRFSHYYWVIVNMYNEIVGKSSTIHATSELAKRAAKGQIKKQDKGKSLKIMKKPAIPPPATDFMKICYMCLMEWKLQLHAQDACEGCIFKSKEETDHGPEHSDKLGCDSSLKRKADTFFNHCRVRPMELIELFNQLRSECDVNPIPAYQLARACIEYHNEADFLEFFSEYPRLNEKIRVLQELVDTMKKGWMERQKKRSQSKYWW